jgi:hypothetical protein
MSEATGQIERCAFCKVVNRVLRDTEDGLFYCVDTETCLYRFEIASRHWMGTLRTIPGAPVARDDSAESPATQR